MTLPFRTAVAPLALACLPVHAGCEQVDGGAVEVSWSLYDQNGSTTNCGEFGVEEMVIEWEVVGDGSFHFSFECGNYHGVTDFQVPAGEAALWLHPRCHGVDATQGTFSAPPPIVRTITAGEVVTLDTQLIQLDANVCEP
jgi:hypothetical protein